MTQISTRPGRPLGLSLAIILSVFLFSILPLFRLGVRLFVQERLSRIDSPVFFEGEEYRALASGSDVIVQPAELILDGGMAFFFLVLGILAWRGGRPWIRPIFTGTMLALAGLTAYVAITNLLRPENIEQGVSSADTLVRALLSGQLTATVLVPLYVIWYLNRAPARAFFRGTYDTPPTSTE